MAQPDDGQEQLQADRGVHPPGVTREALEAALREAVASANEVAAKIQGIFELPDDDGGPRFR